MDDLEDLHQKAIIKITGSLDVHGLPVMAVGEMGVADLVETGAEGPARLLMQYRRVLELTSHNDVSSGPIALILDLSHARKVSITSAVDFLNAVERERKGTLGIAYILKPKTHLKAHRLKQQLNLKPDRDTGRMCPFRVVLVKNHRELHAHVDSIGLTPEFGGLSLYDRSATTALLTKLLVCVRAVGELLSRLPGLRDRVELQQEYETAGLTSQQLRDLQSQLAQQFQAEVSASGLEETVTLVKQTLHSLESPESGMTLGVTSGVAFTLAEGARHGLRSTLQRLQEARQEIQDTAAAAQDRLAIAASFLRCRDKAQEVQQALKTRFLPQLAEHPVVGRSLSQAELYRTHFTSSLYEPAKELLSRSTEILEEVQRLSREQSDVAEQHADIAVALSEVVQPFALRLQRLQDCYVAVHVFYTLYDKSQAWYRKVLRLLPETLLRKLEEEAGPKGGAKEEAGEGVLLAPPEWRQSVRTFLTKHPPPRPHHLEHLDRDVPSPVSRLHRHQAHVLALRVRFLQRFLASRRLPGRLVRTVFRWKAAALGAPPSSPVRPLNARARVSLRPPAQPRAASTSSEDRDDTLPRSASDKERRQTKRRQDRLQIGVGQERGKEQKEEDRKAQEKEEEEERFIRLTYTPYSPNAKQHQHFTFDVRSDPSPINPDPGSESGIEVTETGDDPWDSLVDKIREVSSSSLSSDLKLKYVTDLLSCSLNAGHALPSKPRPLREMVPPTNKPHRYQRRQSPAAQVARMRRRLARSTADLPTATAQLDSEAVAWGSDSENDLTLHDPTLSHLAPNGTEGYLAPSEGLHPLRHSRSLFALEPGVGGRAGPGEGRAEDWDWVLEPGGLSQSTSTLDLQDDLLRLQQCHHDRLQEEAELEVERERCDWLLRDEDGAGGVVREEIDSLDLESLRQDTVESALRRAEHILKLEEERQSQSAVPSLVIGSQDDAASDLPALHRDNLALIFDQSKTDMASRRPLSQSDLRIPALEQTSSPRRESSAEVEERRCYQQQQQQQQPSFWSPMASEVNRDMSVRQREPSAAPAYSAASVDSRDACPRIDDLPFSRDFSTSSRNASQCTWADDPRDDTSREGFRRNTDDDSWTSRPNLDQTDLTASKPSARLDDSIPSNSREFPKLRDPPRYSRPAATEPSLAISELFAPQVSKPRPSVRSSAPQRSSTLRVRHTDIPATVEDPHYHCASPELRVRYTDIPDHHGDTARKSQTAPTRPASRADQNPSTSTSSVGVSDEFGEFRRHSGMSGRGLAFGRVDSADLGYDSTVSLRSSALGRQSVPEPRPSFSEDPQLW